MIDERLAEIAGVRSLSAYKDALVRFADDLGFRYVSAVAVVDQTGPRDARFHSVDNMPEAFRGYADEAKGRSDPVLQHCKRSVLPLVWGQQTYVEAGQAEAWDVQAGYGYKSGIAIAHHLPGGRHFVIGFDADASLPADPQIAQALIGRFCMLSAYALAGAESVLFPTKSAAEAVALTAREREVLQWTSVGKTADDIGSILGVTGRTVVKHLQGAMAKLDCTSKHQAVVKALQMGVI